jgi:hypothetical protein
MTNMIFSKEIFTNNEGLVKMFIPDAKLQDLSAVINLIYNGTVEIQPQQLLGFQKVAQMLQIPLPKIIILPMVEPEPVTEVVIPAPKALQEAFMGQGEKSLKSSKKESFQELQVETAPSKVQKVRESEDEKASIETAEKVKEGEPNETKEETEDNHVEENTKLTCVKRSKRKRKEIFKVSEGKNINHACNSPCNFSTFNSHGWQSQSQQGTRPIRSKTHWKKNQIF